MKDNLEILIPTYNEGNNIGSVIKELNNEGYFKITVLDANSTDKTVEVAKELNCKIILDDTSIKGFGGSLINGLKNLTSDYFCIYDGDGSFDPKDIINMIDKINLGNDFVFASRYLNNQKSDDDTIITRFGNFLFTFMVQILFKIKTTDVLFLYVLGKKSKVDQLNLQQQDFSICTEFVIKAYKNYSCSEIFSKERKRLSGESKVNKFMDGLKIMINIIRIYFTKK